MILARSNINSIRVSDGEPLLRNLCNRDTIALYSVLVLQYIALRHQRLTMLDIDLELVAQRCKPRFSDRGNGFATTQNVHAVSQGQFLFPNRCHLVAAQIFKHKGITKTQQFAVNGINGIPLFVFDRKIVPQRN